MAHPNVKIIDLLVLCANVSSVTEEDINQNSRRKTCLGKVITKYIGTQILQIGKERIGS